MALFSTRVELHNASTAEDYKKLHEEMGKEGFWRTIQLTGGEVYQLPTAEYNFGSNTDSAITTKNVLELAKKAAARTGKIFMVLVTKSDGMREWYNLPKANK